MPSAWLGENSIPEVEETSSGVFEFGLYRNARNTPRVVAYAIIVVFASVICVPGLVFSYGVWRPFLLVLGFYFVVLTLLFFTIFKSSSYVIDTKARTLTRFRYLSDWMIQKTSWTLTDEDEFTVYLSADDSHTGGFHSIYLTTNGYDQFVCRIHLPTATPSDELIRFLDDLATQLHIFNSGYRSTTTYLRRRLRFRL